MEPRQLWKTTIVVWTDEDPRRVSPSQLVRMFERGDADLGKCHSELVEEPYQQEDGPSEDFFEQRRERRS